MLKPHEPVLGRLLTSSRIGLGVKGCDVAGEPLVKLRQATTLGLFGCGLVQLSQEVVGEVAGGGGVDGFPYSGQVNEPLSKGPPGAGEEVLSGLFTVERGALVGGGSCGVGVSA